MRSYITFAAVLWCKVCREMRELLFTNCGLTSTTNLAVSNSKFEPAGHQAPVIRSESEQQNFTEKIKRISERKRPSYSFEISPARSEKDFEHLLTSAADAVNGGLAAFASVTWHLSPPVTVRHPSHWSSVPAVRTALGFSELAGRHSVLLHLSAAGLRERDVADVLAVACREEGACGLFLVRGDGETSRGDFEHAVDLVRFVRSLPEGGRLAVGVAGYPLGHPESRSREEDLLHLREKVKAGADFIISQVVFDASTFVQFVEDCRHIGITVPILAGVPIVTDVGLLGRLCKLCRVPVPEAVLRELSRGGRNAGVQWCVRMCRQLLAAAVDGIHFFTLNSIENLKEVLRQLPVERDTAEAGASGCGRLQPSVYESQEFPRTATQNPTSEVDLGSRNEQKYLTVYFIGGSFEGLQRDRNVHRSD